MSYLYKNSNCKKKKIPLFYLYLPLYDFCINIPVDGMSTGQNM